MGYHKSNKFGLLNFFVYAIVIILGIWVITYISNKYNFVKEAPEGESSTSLVCENLSAKIILESKIQDMKEVGNKLILLTVPEAGSQQIIIFDYCQNKIISDLLIEIKDKKVKDLGELESNSIIG
ncbi:hypothetical protein NF27_DP01740 [Candidatus Jidaibacter acanthamoeba]|uniref:Transmembrane protein n=1 Tax=Candidatus Jidaibacter acanthamoebae TaxID=86105 RepID=A0A0C1R009_9RICK|nr:hypothetical protein [Candidatus Jidaibacter acanthamoeba]KIE05630.1 hypothetical protein NF27_DP01740 [Candidatus Jidaibacter acanthamoeba]